MQRRTLLSSLATVGTVAIAGCSNSSESASDPEPEQESTEDGDNSGEEEDSDQNTSNGNSDTIHNGEEQLENMMSTQREERPLKEEGTWIEFENPGEQIDSSMPDFNSYLRAYGEGGRLGSPDQIDVSTTYVYFRPSEIERGDFLEVFLDSDGIETSRIISDPIPGDTEAEFAYNHFSNNTGQEEYEHTEFFEHVSDYSDVSDDFPDEYLEAIKE